MWEEGEGVGGQFVIFMDRSNCNQWSGWALEVDQWRVNDGMQISRRVDYTSVCWK
jgi:hypothetical protein